MMNLLKKKKYVNILVFIINIVDNILTIRSRFKDNFKIHVYLVH